jgi:uncharacterized membrane protein YedE/YeeE
MTATTKTIAHGAVAFAAGLLFAIGLGTGDLTQPARVIGFLDVLGDWDPTIVFVMASAVAVHGTVYWTLIVRRQRPWLAPTFDVPRRRDIDRRLLGGAALFGAGWGLAGFCPGLALSSLASGASNVIWFMLAMLTGMMAYHAVAITSGSRMEAPHGRPRMAFLSLCAETTLCHGRRTINADQPCADRNGSPPHPHNGPRRPHQGRG